MRLTLSKAIRSSYCIKKIRYYSQAPTFYSVESKDETDDVNDSKEILLGYVSDRRILYSSLVQKQKMNLPFYLAKKMKTEMEKSNTKKIYDSSVSTIVEHYIKKSEPTEEVQEDNVISEVKSYDYPLSQHLEIEPKETKIEDTDVKVHETTFKEDIAYRLDAYNREDPVPFRKYINKLSNMKSNSFLKKFYTEQNSATPTNNISGSVNSKKPRSNVPCGGCGAFLHCQAEGLPGYIPSELFIGASNQDLRNLICQRCYYLENYNMALNIRVSPKVYEKILHPISKLNALFIIVVDMTDAPCCIWPALSKLLGKGRPIVVVGNKIDLLPPDGPDYLETVENCLEDIISRSNLADLKVIHTALVSAKTGYGIENLISSIQKNWGINGNIYLIGCTNVGKSSLFNALLGSDLCADTATNLIRRATTSPWPGTTLNLLKFPLLKPSGSFLFLRRQRLESNVEYVDYEEKMKFGIESNMASLMGNIKRTVDASGKTDPFEVDAHNPSLIGIDDKKEKYANSKWCYDTPGTVQPDQLLCLLTHEELIKVLPNARIKPRTFSLRSGESLFIAGLSRIDLLYSASLVNFVVFASSSLPVTVVRTIEASAVYKEYLGAPLLAVPCGSQNRLSQWKGLEYRNLHIEGSGLSVSNIEIVLSSSGFVSVLGMEDGVIDLRCWTPGARGIYLRRPLLPNTFNLKGKKIRGTPAYQSHVVYGIPKSQTAESQTV